MDKENKVNRLRLLSRLGRHQINEEKKELNYIVACNPSCKAYPDRQKAVRRWKKRAKKAYKNRRRKRLGIR